MVPVSSLLNPLPFSHEERFHDTTNSLFGKEVQRRASPLKQKPSKATRTSIKGKANGRINYSPFEILDEATIAECKRFDVRPFNRISEFPRRIPYNSEKKTFQQRTGRDGFEVYQYTFRMPLDTTEKDPHTVMWDYNVGLVRMTSFFKSLGHNKTMPARMMNVNTGLKEISHSITGGSISAQGYWVPFEAAKAVAATFCYEIRYALVPIFGPNFVASCHKPKGQPNLRIDSRIIRQCTGRTFCFQTESRENSVTRSSPASPMFNIPEWTAKSLQPKPIKPMEVESGYGTDTDRSELPPNSPVTPKNNGWTPINTPKYAHLGKCRIPRPETITSTPFTMDSPSTRHADIPRGRKRPLPQDFESSADEESLSSFTPPDPRVSLSPRGRNHDVDTPQEMLEAAYALIQLSMADAALGKTKEKRSRRNSM